MSKSCVVPRCKRVKADCSELYCEKHAEISRRENLTRIKKTSVQKTIYLEHDMNAKIEREAAELGLSFSSYVEQVLKGKKIEIQIKTDA